MNLIGRQEERNLLREIVKSGEPEPIAIYERRRVGKFFLIQNVFYERLALEITGTRRNEKPA